MHRRAFTLIELLIVVAIIAILAAIAVPNFLEAQTRARVARVKADFRTMKTGMESYRIDFNTYTPNGRVNQGPALKGGFEYLTRPIKYMTIIPLDPFGDHKYNGNLWPNGYQMLCGKDGVIYAGWDLNTASSLGAWPIDIYYIASVGPDKVSDIDYSNSPALGEISLKFSYFPVGEGWGFSPGPGGTYIVTDLYYDRVLDLIYDPTNGAVSFGEIVSSAGNPGASRTLQRFRAATE
jgi:prepilin-type N-terminal cleavage/methylation domain-containing protein